jgi:hypothetical protein
LLTRISKELIVRQFAPQLTLLSGTAPMLQLEVQDLTRSTPASNWAKLMLVVNSVPSA